MNEQEAGKIKEYNVRFYYLATGMGGEAEIRNYTVFADCEASAKRKAAILFAGGKEKSESDLQWLERCMTVIK